MTANEKPDNYWLFQCNPKMIDLKGALRAEALSAFPVKAHLSKIKTGDRAVLWMSGPGAGCYGLATICSEVEDLDFPEKLSPFLLQKIDAEKMVRLDLQYNLWNQPITKGMIAALPYFQDFPAGVPGTTFEIKARHYEMLVRQVRELELLEEPLVDYESPLPPHPAFNLILYGPPGAGKTYQTVNHALSVIEFTRLEELALEKRSVLNQRYQTLTQQGRIAMVTFHASFAYEDFVEGIKPQVSEQQLSYEIHDGIFKRICLSAHRAWSEHRQQEEKNPAAKPPRFVLIIDEINRGNIPNIFGELITLIEADKRAGMPEARQVLLPYSKTPFSIPPNLYLIGTMNTADRTTTHMDAALRRRFAFRHMAPAPALLAKKPGAQELIRGINLEALLRAVNERITLLLDAEHCIGHGFFMHIQDLDDLKAVFYDYLIPQLQEYFFNDLGKIGLILGQGFVEKTERPPGKSVFAKFNYPFAEELLDKNIYTIKNREEVDETAFINIYQSEK